MDATPISAPEDHPYRAEIALERERWAELTGLCRAVTPSQRLLPGYFEDRAWSIKDMVAHIGTWLAEAENQLQRIEAGTYVEAPLDVDALNAQFLEAMRDQSWDTVWTQAHAARGQMLATWYRLSERTEPADRWVRKSGAEHYEEHLGRLRAWVALLQGNAGRG